MPLFDYHCEFCDTVTEHLIKQDDPEPTCHYCQGSMTRLLSAPANSTGQKIQYVNKHLDRIGAKEFKD